MLAGLQSGHFRDMGWEVGPLPKMVSHCPLQVKQIRLELLNPWNKTVQEVVILGRLERAFSA